MPYFNIKPLNDKLRKRGFEIGRELGSGTRGRVYELTGNLVLKITNDRSEAEASQHVKDNPHQNIVKFVGIFKIPKILSNKLSDGYDDELYAIILEKLLPLNDYESDLINSQRDFDTYHAEQFSAKFKFLTPQDRKIILPIMLALKHLEKLDISYRDVHAGNVMKTAGGVYKLIDLGYSQSPPLKRKIPFLEKKYR